MYHENNIFSSKHLGYFLVGSFDENSAFSLRPRLQTFSNADIKPLALLFFACSIDSLQQNQEKMRWQNTLLFHIAFTKHGISFPRPSWLNSVGFASLPDVGKPEWNCKMSASLGLVLKCRPRCFSPEVLKKTLHEKLPNTVQVFSKQLWIATKTQLTRLIQSVPYLAYENVAWWTEHSFRPFFIAANFLSLCFTWLVLMFLQTSWVNLNICRLLPIHNS